MTTKAGTSLQISSAATVLGVILQFLIMIGTLVWGFFQVDKRLSVIEAKFDMLQTQQAQYASKADMLAIQTQYRQIEDRVIFLEREDHHSGFSTMEGKNGR